MAFGIGTLVRWKDDDGTTALGEITACDVKHHAGLDMDLTHVTVRWSDGQEPTQHTLEAMTKDPRVTLLAKPKSDRAAERRTEQAAEDAINGFTD